MKHVITLLLISIFSLGGCAQDPVDIIRKAEEKMRGKESAYTEMTIQTIRPKWTRSMSLKR